MSLMRDDPSGIRGKQRFVREQELLLIVLRRLSERPSSVEESAWDCNELSEGVDDWIRLDRQVSLASHLCLVLTNCAGRSDTKFGSCDSPDLECLRRREGPRECTDLMRGSGWTRIAHQPPIIFKELKRSTHDVDGVSNAWNSSMEMTTELRAASLVAR